MIFKRLIVNNNIIKRSLYKAVHDINQNIIDKILPRSVFIVETQ